MRGNIVLYNKDCMVAMKGFADNAFDLAIVDPPYGIDVDNRKDHGKKRSIRSATESKNYEHKGWDVSPPTKNYFEEIFRITRNQIIWGVNHYPYSILSGGRIFWDKDTAEKFTSGDGELAYCSLTKTIRKFKFTWNGMIQNNMKDKEIRIHPTQKPVQLYKWLLTNYAKEGDRILDTHLGSGSIAIACYDMGFDLTGYEIDTDYFNAASLRLERHKDQGQLF